MWLETLAIRWIQPSSILAHTRPSKQAPATFSATSQDPDVRFHTLANSPGIFLAEVLASRSGLADLMSLLFPDEGIKISNPPLRFSSRGGLSWWEPQYVVEENDALIGGKFGPVAL